MLEHTLSEQERSQILQTIEMFEVITQSQPDDYQSLETLKVAYQKLGKSAEQTKTSRRLAILGTFLFSGFTILANSAPFCEGLIGTGRVLGVSEFVLNH